MRLFFTEHTIINLNSICSVDIKNNIVNTVDGNHTVMLSLQETKNLVSALREIHNQNYRRT